MRIKKAVIKGFGKYNQKTLEFNKGINIIYGLNEAGKSTLLWFIRGMLYGLKGGRTNSKGEKPPRRRFKPWTKDKYSGSLHVEYNKKEYIIQRDFNKKKFTIYNERYTDITEKLLSKNMQPGEFFLGINKDCFEKTCFIGPDGADMGKKQRIIIENKLMDVSRTGYVDVSLEKSLDLLNTWRRENIGNLNDKRTRSDRPLNQVVSKLSKLQEEIKQYDDIKNKLSNLQDEYEKTKVKIQYKKKTVNRINTFEKILNKAGTISNEITKKNSLNQILKKFEDNKEKIKDNHDKQQEYTKVIKKLSRFENANKDEIKNLRTLYEKMRLYTDEYQKAVKDLNTYKKEQEDIVGQFEQYKVFAENNHMIEKVMDLAGILPVFEAESKKSIEIEYTNRINNLYHKVKRNRLFLIIIAVLGILLTGTSAVVNFTYGLITFLLFTGGVIYMLKRVQKFNKHLKNTRDMKKEGANLDTDEYLKYENMDKRFHDILNTFKCRNIRDFKNKINEYKNIENNLTNINTGKQLKKKVAADKKQQLKRVENELKESVNRLSDSKMEYNDIDIIKKIEDQWSKYNETTDNLANLKNQVNDLHIQKENIISRVKTLGYKNIEKVREEILKTEENIQSEIYKLKESIWKYDNKKLKRLYKNIKKENVHNIQSQISDFTEKNINNRKKQSDEYNNLLLSANRLENEISGLWDKYSNYPKATEEFLKLKKKKEKLLYQDKLIIKTADELKKSGDRVKKSFYKPLTEKLKQYVSMITLGKYADIKISEQLTMNAVIKDTGEIKNIMDFSTGTVEQIFFAMRMAAVELIEGHFGTCPLFADEIFASYDEKRVENTLKLLSKQRQFFIFTCRTREPEIAQKVCQESNIIRL